MSAGVDYWKEALAYSLGAAGVPNALTDEQAAIVAAELDGWGENQGLGAPDTPDPYEREIADLEVRHAREIADLQTQIDAYRRSVATRRNVDKSAVYVKDGAVLYDPAG
jgi:hypothetical protein